MDSELHNKENVETRKSDTGCSAISGIDFGFDLLIDTDIGGERGKKRDAT